MPDEPPITQAQLRAALDAAVETIAGEISNLRQEMNARFTDADRRLDRVSEGVSILQAQTISVNRWAERLDKDQSALGQNYFNQQHEIEALKRRLEALEKKAG